MPKRNLIIGLLSGLLLLPVGLTSADTLKDFVRSQLDGKGSVSNIDLAKHTIVVDDRLYNLARTVTVFDTTRNRPTTLGGVNVNDQIGFKSKALREPTKPYDQQITKIWILESN